MPSSDTAAEKLRQNLFVDVLSWVEAEGESNVVGGSVNRVVSISINWSTSNDGP